MFFFFQAEDGIRDLTVTGVQTCALPICKALEKLEAANEDQRVGIRIVARAFEEPLRQIASNAGDHAEIVLNRVKGHKGSYGYNAATGEYGDLVEEGIIDPAKVTRLALQHAASVAGLLLTTEVTAVEALKKKAPPAPPASPDMDDDF